MDGAEQQVGAKKSRPSGSEKRQKSLVAKFRVTPEEYAQLEELAGRQRLTVASYMRNRTLERVTTASRRRANAQTAVWSGILAQLGRISGNVNQLSKRVNMGDTPLAEEIRSTLAEVRQLGRQMNDLLTGTSI